MRYQSVTGFAFGQHGAPLGGGNLRADFGQRFLIGAFRKTIVPELHCADQPAMHYEIRVTADRRGEVRIAAKIETEVAVVFRGVFGLSLCAQNNFIDQLLGVAPLNACEYAIERLRFEYAALCKRNGEARKKF